MKIFTLCLSFISIFTLFNGVSFGKSKPKDATKKEKAVLPKINFQFEGVEYHLAFQNENKELKQQIYEFTPAGQNVENWKKMITLIHDMSGKADLTMLDKIAEATLAQMKSKGGFVYNAFSFLDPKTQVRYNVMTFVMGTPTMAEVNIKKVYLTKDSEIAAVTYAEHIEGKSADEIGNKVNSFLKNSKEIGMNFIGLALPSPWETQKAK